MNTHACPEDQLVEQPVIGLFATLGRQTVSALEETFGAGGTLGRETKGEVALADRRRSALRELAAQLPPAGDSDLQSCGGFEGIGAEALD